MALNINYTTLKVWCSKLSSLGFFGSFLMVPLLFLFVWPCCKLVIMNGVSYKLGYLNERLNQ